MLNVSSNWIYHWNFYQNFFYFYFLWIFGGISFLFGFFYNFYEFFKCRPIQSIFGIRSTESVEIRALGSSINTVLNRVCTLIQIQSSSPPFLTRFHFFFFAFIHLSHLQSCPFSFFLLHFLQNLKIPKSPNPNLPQAPFLHLFSISSRPLFHHGSQGLRVQRQRIHP